MLKLGSFFKKGVAEAPANELWQALRAAEAERQTLREREQALSVSRQDVLLEGSDEDLDAIEAELATIARAAERHDLRIPELRRLHAERQEREQAEANRQQLDQAVAQRLALAERIDAKLAELGELFAALEKPAEVLRRLPTKRAAINGSMTELRLDREAMHDVLLHHVPSLARLFGAQDRAGSRPRSFHAVETEFMGCLRGVVPAVLPLPQPRQMTAEDADAAEATRHQAGRYREGA